MKTVYKDETVPGSADLGPLPEWDLKDLYPAPDAAGLKTDFAAAESRIAAFEKNRGKVADLDGAAFGAAIAEYEIISEILGKIASYAQLYKSEDEADQNRGRFYQDTVEHMT